MVNVPFAINDEIVEATIAAVSDFSDGFRNSLLPMITIFAGILPGLLGGAVVVERIFYIKGMGDLVVTATNARDLPIVQAVAFIASVVTLASLLLADLCYVIADPRVSFE